MIEMPLDGGLEKHEDQEEPDEQVEAVSSELFKGLSFPP
jgi:hypothetical protein